MKIILVLILTMYWSMFLFMSVSNIKYHIFRVSQKKFCWGFLWKAGSYFPKPELKTIAYINLFHVIKKNSIPSLIAKRYRLVNYCKTAYGSQGCVKKGKFWANFRRNIWTILSINFKFLARNSKFNVISIIKTVLRI